MIGSFEVRILILSREIGYLSNELGEKLRVKIILGKFVTSQI